MARPTKEEAAWWGGYLQQAQLQGEGLRADQIEGLRVWIERVQAALPSAQAVQRDRERRKVARHFDRPGRSYTEGQAIPEDGR